jgi:type II secretory pathway predicted ATPase ExeA
MLRREATSTYLEHFGLRERPFSNAPDLRFVYLGPHHEQAIAHLLRGMEVPGSVVLLTGESGIGKTTTCRALLSRLPERVDVALIVNPALTPVELRAFLCHQLGLAYETDTDQAFVDALHGKLSARLGTRRTVLVVDEAQSLVPDVVDQLFALSNMELEGRKLVEIILIGEPPLIDLVGRATAHRSSQSPTGYYLLPFAEAETAAYVRHRLAVAGVPDLFEPEALRDVHRLSGGVPGLINAISERALSIAVPQGRRSVDAPTVRAAARSARTSATSPALAAARQGAPRPRPPRVPLPPAPKPARRTGRPLRPWLIGGGLALAAVAIGAIFLGPRAHDVGVPAVESRAEADSPIRVEPLEADAVETQPQPARPPDTGEQLDPARLIPPPMSSPLLVTPGPARPLEPGMRVVPGPPASSDESPRQDRRRARADLRAAPGPPQSAVQPQVPPAAASLKIDFLLWASEPKDRLVFMNGRKYVEGETLENGAILQEIQEDGIVMFQNGLRIQVRREG